MGGIIDDQGPVHNSTTILAKQSGYTIIRSEANLIKISILASTRFGVGHFYILAAQTRKLLETKMDITLDHRKKERM